ncbi:MAG: hypothetical protein HGA19_11845 [Oscillochloris sp.]|nr:hypothetical protein [Oscillochloris sp.]
MTFFLSISFAIFGLSFQAQITSPLRSISRISALVIYWFGVLLFLRFHTYNRLLRQYLRDLERQGRTSIVVYTRYHAAARGPSWLRMNAGRLLVSFGLLDHW